MSFFATRIFFFVPSAVRKPASLLLRLLLTVIVIFSNSGCGTGLGTSFMLGAAFSIGLLSRQERSIGEVVDDVTIWASIKNKYFKHHDRSIFRGVNVDVAEGRVLLSGGVLSQLSKVESVRIAWTIDGVVEVVDKIVVLHKKLSLQSIAKDALIATRIRAILVLDKNIRSMNYTIDVFDGVVYVVGIARNKEELGIVHRVIQEVDGVRKIESYVRIKPSKYNNNAANNVEHDVDSSLFSESSEGSQQRDDEL